MFGVISSTPEEFPSCAAQLGQVTSRRLNQPLPSFLTNVRSQKKSTLSFVRLCYGPLALVPGLTVPCSYCLPISFSRSHVIVPWHNMQMIQFLIAIVEFQIRVPDLAHRSLVQRLSSDLNGYFRQRFGGWILGEVLHPKFAPQFGCPKLGALPKGRRRSPRRA